MSLRLARLPPNGALFLSVGLLLAAWRQCSFRREIIYKLIAFADLNDDMDLMEAMIKYIIKDVMARCPQDIDFFNQFVDKGLKERLEHVANSDFVRISYTDAVKLLEKNNDNFEYKVSWGCDLQT